MPMYISDTLKTIIAIIIFVISAALTDFIRNTMFLFKEYFVPQKEIVCFKAGTCKRRNLALFFLSAALAPQQAVKGLCPGTGETLHTACALVVA